MPETHAVITLRDGLPDSELDVLVKLLDEAGLDAEIGSPNVRMGSVLGTVTSAVIEVPVTVLVTVLMTAAGKRFWGFFTEALDRARRRRHEDGDGDDASAGEGVAVVIVDTEETVRVELTWDTLGEAPLPDLSDQLGPPSDDRSVIVFRWNRRTGAWERY